MAIELVHLCDVDITLREPIEVGAGPAGMRMIFEVESAKLTGNRINGELVGQAAADWLVVNGTTASLDVRAAIRTDDGAVVFAEYHGRSDASQGPGTSPIYVAPRFETGDERYAWLNSVQAVGKGQLDGLSLHYEWYEAR